MVLEALDDSDLLKGCPRQLTHGDYQGRNSLFRGRTLSGIIDFERLEYRPRLYDMAWPFVFWRWFGTSRGPYTAADWRQARACCSAYAAASPQGIADAEWVVLPLLMAYIPARGIAQAADEDAPIGEVLAFGQAIEFAAWLVEHPDAALARLRNRKVGTALTRHASWCAASVVTTPWPQFAKAVGGSFGDDAWWLGCSERRSVV